MQDYDIVCIAPNAWEGQIWRRRHHLMRNLAKRHRVLYVEPAYFSIFHFMKNIFRLLAMHPSIKKISNNLWTLKLYNLFPFEETALRKGIGTIKRINDEACLYQIKKALKLLDFKNDFLLWVYYTPRTAYLLKKLKANFIVCDVFDKYAEYSTVDPWQKDYIDNEERTILKNSDIVFSASQPLLDYSQRYNSKCYLIPHGVDEIFCETDVHTVDTPDDLKSIPPPRIGYIGSVYDKLDYGLLLNVIKICRDYSFVFIGPLRIMNTRKRQQYSELIKLSNVFTLGLKDIRELPEYYKGLDVCIAPYDTSFEQTKWADLYVCKMWEYVSSGKPIVLTLNRGIDPKLRQSVIIADNHTSFTDAIERALKEGGNIDKEANIRLAKDNTWPKRVAEMERIVGIHRK
jgi:teichuronic acid biosynthesis glycosyltransferase TuaH